VLGGVSADIDEGLIDVLNLEDVGVLNQAATSRISEAGKVELERLGHAHCQVHVGVVNELSRPILNAELLV